MYHLFVQPPQRGELEQPHARDPGESAKTNPFSSHYFPTVDPNLFPPNTTRYTVGFGGESTVGLHKAYLADDQNRIYHDGFTAEEVDLFPMDCAISGQLTYNDGY